MVVAERVIDSFSKADQQLIKMFDELPADFWDFKSEDTRYYTHGIHGYPAVMVSPISRNLISLVKKIHPINSLLDPFMGSGSVLIESQLANINEIYGIDLNPLAQLLSKVRTTILTEEETNQIQNNFIPLLIKELDKNEYIAIDFENFITFEKKLDITEMKGWGENAHDFLNEYCSKNSLSYDFPQFKNIGFWFKPKVIFDLMFIKNLIRKSKNQKIKNFLMITFSEVVRKVSNTRNSEFKLFRMTKESIVNTVTNTKQEFLITLKRNIDKMQSFAKKLHEFNNESNVHIISGDTRNINTIKSIPNDSIDLMVTSPPYGDSKTTVAYGQYSRLSLHWIDLDDESCDVVAIDKNLLGGIPYKNKTQWAFLGSNTLIEQLTQISDKDLFRADDVFSFYNDLDKCIYGINTKMKKGSYQFWVVGNRTVKGINLRTDLIIAEMAKKYGLQYLHTVKRNIMNKVMPYANSPTNEVGKRVSTITKELIVILKKG